MELPEAFKQRMRELLGGEYAAFESAFSLPRHYGLRANTLKIKSEAISGLLKTELVPVPWCGDGFYYDYDAGSRLSKSPYYAAGLYYIQEPSAMSAAGTLDISPGQRVLDLCAAPGGKTAQAAAKLGNTGVLVSNDINSKRIPPLLSNIQLMGITNALVTNESPERLAAVFEGYFDRIIVDAPCSGEGMFRKESDAAVAWDAGKSARLNAIQVEILEQASIMLRPGGVISYSTCTFAPEENERLIGAFLRKHGAFELAAIDHQGCGLSAGRPEWADGNAELAKTVRIWPHIQRGEGHFIAQLRKNPGAEASEPRGAFAPEELDAGIFAAFAAEYMKIPPPVSIMLHGDSLLLPPSGLPSVKGLRIARCGLLLGRMRRGRFEPSEALALASHAEDFKNTIYLAADSEELKRYLRGDAFDIPAAEGYNLLCVDGYPLGIVKIMNGRLKWRAGM